jgi:integrase
MAENGLAPATIRLTHTALRRALNDAIRWGKLARNPATAATVPKASETGVSAWTAAELRRFLAGVEDDPLFALWRLAATTGMRRGEVLGLTWRCLDLDGARLEVVQQLRPDLTFGPPKTRRSERTIALDAETVEALRRHQAAQVLERDFASTSYDDRDLVFADALGGPIRPQTLTERFARHRTAAGILTGTLHVLRHTAATLALTASPPVPLHIVAARLGDDPRTMLHTYAHLLPQSDVAAAETVATMLAPDFWLTSG